VTATDAQVRIALLERSSGCTQQQAAAKVNLRSRKTVAKYEARGRLPSEVRRPRGYRTRRDAFAADWSKLQTMLELEPALEAKTLFDWLSEQRPGEYGAGQLRTFQRRVSEWRALNVPQLLTLEQNREPGRAMQTDGIKLNGLGVTIQGRPLDHWLIHTVLPFSNWEWGVVAQSESLIAIQRAFQSAVGQLQHLPTEHQLDNTTAATHNLKTNTENAQLGESGRAYNEAYLALMAHHGVTPRTTHLSCPDENGDVEALHGAAYRAIEQQLLLRGSRDFASVEEYERWIQAILARRNARREERLREELAVMRPLSSLPLPERREYRLRVSRAGTIQVLCNAYSVPSGLKGRMVTVYVHEWQLEVYYAGKLVQRMPRQIGKGKPQINYRHVIGTLLRKPGGFRAYRYREQMFPTPTFREAWDLLDARLSPRRADITYLRILRLAAEGMESDVELALKLVIADGGAWNDETVQGLIRPAPLAAPAVDRGEVDLGAYDRLLTQEAPLVRG